MKRSVAVLTLLAVAALARADEAPNATPKVWTPTLMLQVKRVASVVPSPDGSRAVYTVRTPVIEGEKSEFVTHIHIAKSDGSESRQLTRGEKSSDGPQWSPDGKWLFFVSARTGKNNLFRISPDGGEAEQLTDVKTAVSSFRPSPDGKSIAFTMSDPQTADEEKAAKEKNDARVVDDNLKVTRLYVVAIEKDKNGKREPKSLTPGPRSVQAGAIFAAAPGYDWSPDSRTIASGHTRSPKVDDWPTADIAVVEVATGKTAPLAETGAAETSPRYSPDGDSIVFAATDAPATWAHSSSLYVVPAVGGKPRALAGTFDQQPNIVGWAPDNKTVFFTEAHQTSVRLYALPLNGQPRVLSPADGVIGSVNLNPNCTRAGFTWETADRAPEAYVSDPIDFKPVALSKVNAEFAGIPTGRTEVVRWSSGKDGEVEGLLTYPLNYEQGKRYPFLLVIHGGPAGVFGRNFVGHAYPYPLAAFSAKGYAILRVNPRGSSGYGKTFRYANYKDWGGGDYRDLMSGVDHVVQAGIADPERMGVMGWSYGGFMTSWVITQTNRFKAASVGAGVTNLVSFTGTADIPSFLPDYFGGEFWDGDEIYRKHSPMFHVKNARTPSLIQHGEKDDRVPVSQGYELYNALKRRGVEVQMVVYPRQPHGITE